MASAEECEQAFHQLAARLGSADPGTRRQAALDRSLSCTVSDIGVIFGARLKDGQLSEIHRAQVADGQVKLTLTSDDLMELVDGRLSFGSAWASGRVKLDAKVLDLLKLRSVF